MVKVRNTYRKVRADAAKKIRPPGYSLNDIWDGDGVNKNAALTVFRHNESAYVMNGARGDLSKTIFVLDYSLFERLVYNLTVNYDLFGNLGHQLFTRIYMAMIRMEAEELFLQFLPSNERAPIREDWYQGPFTDIKMKFLYRMEGKENETAIAFQDKTHTRQELVNKILFTRLNEKARGNIDTINWKKLQTSAGPLDPNSVTAQLRSLAAVKVKQIPFPAYFPDLSLLEIVDEAGQVQKVYSIVANKQMKSLAWLFNDKNRRDMDEDSLIFVDGLAGSYPNLFFRITEKQLPAWRAAVEQLNSPALWRGFVQTYGVSRANPNFWRIYDEIQDNLTKTRPVDGGIIDLSRYDDVARYDSTGEAE